jgi:hypothetical protein
LPPVSAEPRTPNPEPSHWPTFGLDKLCDIGYTMQT